MEFINRIISCVSLQACWLLKGLSFGGQQNLLVLEIWVEPTFQRHHFLNLTLLLTSEPMLLEKLTVLCERSRAETRNFLSNGSGVYSSAAIRLLQSISLDRCLFDTPNYILHIHVDAFGLLVDISTFTHANSLSQLYAVSGSSRLSVNLGDQLDFSIGSYSFVIWFFQSTHDIFLKCSR